MDRGTVWSWALFDFANSIFPAVMVTTVFSIYYVNLVVGGEGGEGDWWWSKALSVSALVVAFSSPFLGAVADRTGARKRFLTFYVGLCVAGVLGMVTLDAGMALRGFVLFVVANVGFESALVFYNAYLPEIAPQEKRGWVSGLGFGLGYLGSALGLLLVLPFAQTRRFDVVWLVVAGFFVVFSLPALRRLPSGGGGDMRIGEAVGAGLAKLRETVREIWGLKDLRNFLLSYFFYVDGVLTIIAMAAVVASRTFGFEQDEIIVMFLIVQFSALAGAFALAKPTDWFGPKAVLNGVLLLWIVAGVSAYFIQDKTTFYVLAVIAGLGLGVVQSTSRVALSALIPKGKEAEMFGFYALCGKSSSVVGPLLFGYVTLLAGGNQRPAFLLLTSFFVIGLALLQRVRGGLDRSVAS